MQHKSKSGNPRFGDLKGKSGIYPVALTIAGSDCSGGAGLEADLKTFAAFRVFGMAAVTCVVAENPRQVVSLQPVSELTLVQQIDCCLNGMKSVAVKTGLVYSAPLIKRISDALQRHRKSVRALVVDPVMVATSGKRLLQENAVCAMKELIRKHAFLVTPNLDEAEILACRRIRTEGEMLQAAWTIAEEFKCAVLLKGGHRNDPRYARDYLWDGQMGFWLSATRVKHVKTHGTGCTYSAAITANLACGLSLQESVHEAKEFVTHAIRTMCRFKPWMALNHSSFL